MRISVIIPEQVIVAEWLLTQVLEFDHAPITQFLIDVSFPWQLTLYAPVNGPCIGEATRTIEIYISDSLRTNKTLPPMFILILEEQVECTVIIYNYWKINCLNEALSCFQKLNVAEYSLAVDEVATGQAWCCEIIPHVGKIGSVQAFVTAAF